MFDVTRIPELRLSKGAHSSASEGVCFMEAIAWFDGLPHSDHPVCACPVLTAYGISLNDNMPDDVRNRLLRPLVPLVAGTRDPDSERKRAEFLVMRTVNRILPIVLRDGWPEHAEACEGASTLSEAEAAARAADAAAYAAADAAARAADAAYAAADAAARAADAAYAACAAAEAAEASAYAAAASAASAASYAYYAASYAVGDEQIWQLAAEGFREAIKLGRCDGFAMVEALPERANAYRELVA